MESIKAVILPNIEVFNLLEPLVRQHWIDKSGNSNINKWCNPIVSKLDNTSVLFIVDERVEDFNYTPYPIQDIDKRDHEWFESGFNGYPKPTPKRVRLKNAE